MFKFIVSLLAFLWPWRKRLPKELQPAVRVVEAVAPVAVPIVLSLGNGQGGAWEVPHYRKQLKKHKERGSPQPVIKKLEQLLARAIEKYGDPGTGRREDP